MKDCDPALRALLAEYGQEHVLAFWPQLSPEMRAELAAELRGIDLEQLQRLYRQGEAVHDWAALAARAESPPTFRQGRADQSPSPQDARRRGVDALAHVAVVLVAGGQGTRLGFNHPKGMYPIGPLSRSSLFQILLEKTLAIGRRHGLRIPLYVMTSPATHEETAEFLERHGRFGLSQEDVTLFCQGTMPAVDAETGRLLLAAKHRLALSPDGTGGIVSAMQRHGVLRQMRERGLEQAFYMQVDNPLVSVCDVAFLGYHLLAGAEISTQVVTKESPLEPLGNVVSIDGRLRILEYSDLAWAARQRPEILERRLPDGKSVFWAGNLGIHVIDVAFLERMAAHDDLLPFHVARKKVPYVDVETGELVSPTRENAMKFERFAFDMLPAARRSVVVEVDRRTYFAPLKNGPGAAKDTPEAVQAQMVSVHRQWLAEAGAKVSEHARVEISPLWALDAEQVKERQRPGMVVDEDWYFDENS